MYASFGIGKSLVFSIEFGVLRFRDRIVRIAFSLRKLVYHTRLRVGLSRQILKLRHARVGLFVWIVYDRSRLKDLAIMRLMLKLKRPVGKFSIAIVEIGIYGS